MSTPSRALFSKSITKTSSTFYKIESTATALPSKSGRSPRLAVVDIEAAAGNDVVTVSKAMPRVDGAQVLEGEEESAP